MRDLAADRDLQFFSLNTGTVRAHGDLRTILEAAARHGIRTVSPWRDQVQAMGVHRAGSWLNDSGFSLSGYCRGGLFPCDPSQKSAVRDDNRRAVDEAAELGAPCLVIVAGGLPQYNRLGSEPSNDVARARAQVLDGLAEMLDYASKSGMKLALEPLHPMTAAERSCVNTLRQALDICDVLDPERARGLGVAVDVYHVWWDFEVLQQIQRIGANRLLAFHICDWLVPTRDTLNDRGMMGDGVIEIAKLRQAVESEGYSGACEVEVLSTAWGKRPIDEVLATAIERYRTVC
jgi:sugar phosphate isomerase/epimerase